jgi:hypothetical protein
MVIGKIDRMADELAVFMGLPEFGLHKFFSRVDPEFLCFGSGMIGLAVIRQ